MSPTPLAAASISETDLPAIAVLATLSGQLLDQFALPTKLRRNATAEMWQQWPESKTTLSQELTWLEPSNADPLAAQEKFAVMFLEVISALHADGTTHLLASRMPLASIRTQPETADGHIPLPLISALQGMLLLTPSSSRTWPHHLTSLSGTLLLLSMLPELIPTISPIQHGLATAAIPDI
jgi:hypothetical protein